MTNRNASSTSAMLFPYVHSHIIKSNDGLLTVSFTTCRDALHRHRRHHPRFLLLHPSRLLPDSLP